ncbi:TetR/AcrR family transcriptional regulator [Nocardia callitridis]|uniref:TetR/AcrR family transcriptional regulator n=1 Tax=Nocardia callitridis TaxID=648753 RepID=A0ABP9L4S5_9NOCA
MNSPARGTRPANRRELVLAAASELFYRRGYSNVSMRDIAAAVAIGPSALYRHFRTKKDLLEAVVSDAMTSLQKALDTSRDNPTIDAIGALTTAQHEGRAVGVLWHREARHLTDSAQQELRQRIRDVTGQIDAALRQRRPELDQRQADFLAWAVLGVATSISFHTVEVPAGLFTELVHAVAETAIPPLHSGTFHPGGDGSNAWAPSRREAILASTIGLFAARGYADVSVEDIGTAIGIAGPSVYNHFDTKAEILILAMERGHEILRADLHRALGRATGPGDALGRLVTSYSEFALENGNLIRLLNSETDQLPPEDRDRIRTIQHDYITEWTQLVRQAEPARDDPEAHIRVHAALNMINDIATTPHLSLLGNANAAIEVLCADVLRR